MGSGKERVAERLAALDWDDGELVVDVGGGNGSLLVELLGRRPGLRGIVFDLPETVRDESTFPDRCEFVAGDFFVSVPAGDAYVLSGILHDWDDERSVAILKHCRRAMGAEGKLLVVEAVLPPGDEPSPGKLVDVVMLTILTGRERTAAEYGTLYEAAGFDLTRILPTASPMSIIEGTPA